MFTVDSIVDELSGVKDLTATIEARQKLDYQQSESDLVLKVRLGEAKASFLPLTRLLLRLRS